MDPARGKKGSHPIADQVDEGMGRPREGRARAAMLLTEREVRSIVEK